MNETEKIDQFKELDKILSGVKDAYTNETNDSELANKMVTAIREFESEVNNLFRNRKNFTK